MAPLTREEKQKHAQALAKKVVSGSAPAAPAKTGLFDKKPTAVPSPPPAADQPKSAKDPVPESYELASRNAENMYRAIFQGQRDGLERLHDTLENLKPPSNLIAELAGKAVGLAVSALLTFVIGPEAFAEAPEEAALIEKLISKGLTAARTAASDEATKGAQAWLEKGDFKESIADFVFAQREAITAAEKYSVTHLLEITAELANVPGGETALKALAAKLDEQSQGAAAQQIVDSAGAWASQQAEAGDEQDWVDKTVDGTYGSGGTEVGWLKLHLKTTPPINSPSDIEITDSDWNEISMKMEHLVERQKAGTIGDLHVNLRLIINEHLYGDTAPLCEINAGGGDPVVPNWSPGDTGLVAAVDGGYKGIVEKDAVVKAAAQLGSLIQKKPVSDLRF